MTDRYSDSAGNALQLRDLVCVERTGDIGRVVAFDRYRDCPVQVMLRRGDGTSGVKPLCRWYGGHSLVRCPSVSEVAGQRFGVLPTDQAHPGAWVR